MLNIYVLEDDFIQQGRIEKIISELLEAEHWKANLFDVFGKPNQLFGAFKEVGPHNLFFLDIEIKGEDVKGLEVAQKIRKKDPTATIVFVTTHSEFMPLTFQYKVAALDFVDKTMTDREFKERLRHIFSFTLKKLGQTISEDAFVFKTKKSHIQVPFKDILYFETSSTPHKVVLYTFTERIEFYGKISDIAKGDERLFLCHRSFVINPANVTRLDKERYIVYFSNGASCGISRLKQKELLARLDRLHVN